MAKITCALTASQLKELFQYTYKVMSDSLEAEEAFDAELFIKNMFDEIASATNPETAAKFVQQLPTLIYAAAGTNQLVDLDMATDPVRKMISKFKNPDTGLNFVLDKYAPAPDANSILNQTASINISDNQVKESEGESTAVDTERLKPFTAMSSTFVEFVKIDPRQKGVVDKQVVDPARMRIYNTLARIRDNFDGTSGYFDGNITYQGKVLKLKAVRLSDVKESMLDETTRAEVVKSKMVVRNQGSAKVGTEKVAQANERVALILSDDKGNLLYFDQDGNITTEAEGGQIVYQFMRNIRVDAKNSSRLRATDIYGQVDMIQTPEEIYNGQARNMKMSDDEYADYLFDIGTSKEEVIAEIDREQQADFRAIKEFTDKITKEGESKTIALTGVSLGVPVELVINRPTFGQIQNLPFVTKENFQGIRIVKEPRDGFEKGNYTIKLNGSEFQIDRADMTKEIANKIAHALTMSKLSNKDKYTFISYFMNNNISEKVKKYNIYYNEQTDELEISFRPLTVKEAELKGIKKNDFVKVPLVPENLDTIFKGLMEGNYYKKKLPSKMTYNEQALIDNAYYDYDMETGTLNRRPSKYVDLIMSYANTEVYLVENKDPGFFNSYMHFGLDQAYTKRVDEAISEVQKNLTIAEKKAAIVEALGQGKEVTGTISKPENAAGNTTQTQWQFTDSKGSVVNFYNHNTNETPEMYEGKVATLVLAGPMTGSNGVFYADPVSVYIGNKFIGYVQEKGYSKGDEVIDATEEVVATPEYEIPVETSIEEQDKAILAPDDMNTPDDDESFTFGLDRSAELPNNVTQEQIDEAKKWWDNSPLSKFVSIEHMANIVNSNVFARFVASGKKLATPGTLAKIQINKAANGNYVDVYHEAWHVFSQLFLTKNDKIALYKEVRNSNPKWKNLKFLEIEEMIAEDFRSYALDPKPKKDMPKRNTIFRIILNFLRKFFGNKKNINNVSEVRSVKELYDKLYFADKNPNLLKNYTPLVDNVMWDMLNRGPESIANKEEEVYNSQDGKLVVQSIDSVFSNIIDVNAKNTGNKAGTVAILSDKYFTKEGISNREAAYTMAKRSFIDKLNAALDEIKAIGTPQNAEEDARQDLLKDNIRIFTATINNWGDAKSGIVKYHIEKSTFETLRQKATIVEIEAEENESAAPEDVENTALFKESNTNDKSLDQLADQDTLYILKSLFKVDSTNRRQKNRLGFDELADFPTVWNNVVRAIGGVKDPEIMFQRLTDISRTFPELRQLVDYKLPDPSKVKNAAEIAITTGFWQSFKKSRISYIQVTWFRQDDGTYVSEVTEASNQVSSVIYKFKNKFKAAEANNFISKTDKNNSILKLDNIVKTFAPNGRFDTKKSWEFVRAIGIQLDDLKVIKDALENNPHIYGLEYLFKVVKTFNELDNDVNASKQAKEYVKKFKEDPITTLTKVIPAGILGPKEVLEKNLIEKLAELQGRYGADSSNFSVLNAERKLVFEHTEDFSASMQIHAINDVKNIQDLWKTDRYKYMSYLNPNTNPFTMRSKVLNSLFILDTQDEKFDRRRDRVFALNAVSGTQLDDNVTGANTTSLDKYGKFIQEMHMMLKGGLQEFMRHASKSASFGAHVEGGLVIGRGKGDDNHLYVDIDKFATDGEAESFAIDNVFIDYIASELERIIKFKANIDEYKNYSGYNRVIKDKDGNELGLAGEFFTAFDNVLSKDTKNKLLSSTDQMDTRNVDFLHYYLDKNSDVREMIIKDITQYFNDQTKINVDFFNKNSYIDPALSNRLSMYNLSKEDEERVLVKAFTYNSWIHNFEMANLFYGDVTQFNHSKDEAHKRIPGATSSGNGFRSDIGAQKYVNNILNSQIVDNDSGLIIKANTYAGVLNMTRKSDKYDNFKYNGTLNTAVLRDIKRPSMYLGDIEKGLREDYETRFKNATKEQLLEQLSSTERTKNAKLTKDELKNLIIDKRLKAELDPYRKMNEADGQGYITFDAYRTLRVLENKWTKDHENLYQKIIARESINTKDIVKFFPVYKLQHFGPVANTDLPVTAMHKFALMPLIPSVIKGSDLESLHEQMLKENIQYSTFESGSKVGNVLSDGQPDQIYDNDEQKSIIKPNEKGEGGIKFTKNTIYVEYLKDVTSVPDKAKGKTIFSTQLRKLILEGLYEQGAYVNPNFKDLTQAYEDAVDEYSDILRLEILNEIGYTYKDGKYQGDLAKFLDVVHTELERKELPQHLIDYIGVTESGNVTNDLSFHLEAEDIEKIIVSLLTKRLIKQKVKGEALVQVASTMTNGLLNPSPKFTKATTDEIKKYLGSNTLPFYNKTEKGTSAMKVAVAMQGDFNNLFKAKDLDGNTIGVYDTETVTDKNGKEKKVQKLRFQESLDRLNELIKDEDWLDTGNNRKLVTMTAVRIPVQGLNSMEFMEVHHFLAPEAGSIIIPPSEIVAKSGADYDVDKLTTFMPNIDSDGRFAESTATTEDIKRIVEKATDQEQAERIIAAQKAAIENRIIQSTRNILAMPENYANLIRPNETYLLKDIADELEDQVTDYDKFATSHDEGPRYDGKKKVISPTRIFEVGFNIYKQEVNMGGKQGLGLVALKNAIKPIFNSLGARMPKTYKASEWNERLGRYEEGKVDYDMRLLLPHNTINGAISLSNLYDAYGVDRISDLYSHMMNGLVDVEKDSWIFNIQGNMEVLPVLSYLMATGVPRQLAVNFVSQPLVRQYVERQRIMNSPYAKLTGNVPGENTSIAGQAVKDVLQLPEDVTDKATILKAIDAVRYSDADSFKIVRKDVSGSVILSKEETLELLKDDKNIGNFTSIIPSNGEKSLISAVDKNPLSTTNYYYTAKAATEGVDNFDLDVLSRLINNNDTESKTAIAAFTHFLEIEKQIMGLEALQRVANPDTKNFKTIEEIIQREYDLDTVSIMSKLDPDLVSQLREDSILSKFFDNELVKDLLEPLFILRNNPAVSEYITNVLNTRKSEIRTKYGAGADGVTLFINQFKNAIVNYAYQNHMSNSIDDKGNIVEVPEMHNDLDVVRGKAVNGARVEGDKIIIDMDVINKDFSAANYERNSTGPESYAKRGLKAMNPADNMFNNKGQFIKFVLEREYLRSITPVESIEKNKDFKATFKLAKDRGISDEKSRDMAYETYLAQNALYNSFNRTALIASDEFAFSNYFFSVLKDYPLLKEKYPVLAQFSEPNLATGEKVLTLNNKSMIKGELAEDYYRNLSDLADPDVIKAPTKSENIRISKMFEMLPLISLYVNGIGYSKYGINKVLVYENFMDKMFEASKLFTDNNMNYDTFNDIFSKIISSRSIFKNYANDAQSTTELPEEPPILVTQTAGGGLAFGNIPVEVNIEEPKSVPAIDISSNAKGLGGGLTNPTELAKSKGNIVNSYPVEFNGVQYKDAEAAYQANKRKYKNEGQGEGSTYDLMVQIITAKFLQNPRLIAATNDAGGSDFILNAVHQPTKKNTIWETGGGNYFILALNEAYLNARSLRQEAKTTQAPTSSKPDVILPIGTSGSGKSTFIKSLPQENLVVISPDDMRVEFTGNINDKSKDKEIYAESANRAIKAIKEGKQVVFDTTNLTKEKRRPFIEAIKKALPNANIQYKLMPLDAELAKQRIKAQIARGENRANVSDETIDRHAKSYKQMLEDIKSEGIINYDTTQSSSGVKPTIDTSREWRGDLESRPVYTKEGINTMRTSAAKPNENFGNPFSEAGYGDTRKVPSIGIAVEAYKEWLLTGYTQWLNAKGEAEEFAGKTEQRKWILDQINQGKLDGATLLYAGKSEARGQGMHPTALAEVVEQLRSKPAVTQPVSTAKEGVQELFDSNPELASIGTPEQYSEWINYLTTQGKLAGTKATDILYHGTYENFEEFDEEKKGANTGINTYQSEDGSEQFYSDSANTIFFSDRKTNAISYTLLGRDKYLSEISNALKDVRSAQKELAQDAVEVLKEVPYFNNLIDKAKKEGKTTKEIIELLGKEETKLAKKYKEGSSSLFTNELAGYENRLKELNKFLSNLDVFKKGNNINFKSSGGNFYITTKNGKIQFSRFDKGQNVLTAERFYADEVNNDKIKDFINDAIAEENTLYNQAKINMKAAGYEEKAIPVLLNLQNPSIHDYEKSSFPDAYKDTKTRTAAFAAKQVADALKNGNDGVIYENIVDPLLSNSYGVFKTEQIYILGGKEDKSGFSNFVNKTTTGQLSLFDDPYTILSDFYNTLSAAQKEKIGTLDELYEEYNQTVYDYSMEEFVNKIKTCNL
jgi:predicted kinase